MKRFTDILASFARDPHVTVPALLCGACKFATIWFPQYTAQLKATEALLAVYTVKAAALTPTTNTTNLTPNSATETKTQNPNQ